jgi:hypothetical protein
LPFFAVGRLGQASTFLILLTEGLFDTKSASRIHLRDIISNWVGQVEPFSANTEVSKAAMQRLFIVTRAGSNIKDVKLFRVCSSQRAQPRA